MRCCNCISTDNTSAYWPHILKAFVACRQHPQHLSRAILNRKAPLFNCFFNSLEDFGGIWTERCTAFCEIFHLIVTLHTHLCVQLSMAKTKLVQRCCCFILFHTTLFAMLDGIHYLLLTSYSINPSTNTTILLMLKDTANYISSFLTNTKNQHKKEDSKVVLGNCCLITTIKRVKMSNTLSSPKTQATVLFTPAWVTHTEITVPHCVT